jgi:hypothetical protein
MARHEKDDDRLDAQESMVDDWSAMTGSISG